MPPRRDRFTQMQQQRWERRRERQENRPADPGDWYQIDEGVNQQPVQTGRLTPELTMEQRQEASRNTTRVSRRAPGYWIQRDGRAIHMRDMEDSHLENCINMVERDSRSRNRVVNPHYGVYAELILERNRRREIEAIRQETGVQDPDRSMIESWRSEQLQRANNQREHLERLRAAEIAEAERIQRIRQEQQRRMVEYTERQRLAAIAAQEELTRQHEEEARQRFANVPMPLIHAGTEIRIIYAADGPRLVINGQDIDIPVVYESGIIGSMSVIRFYNNFGDPLQFQPQATTTPARRRRIRK